MANERALSLLGIANKGGKVAVGEEPVGILCKAGKARLLILASDAAEHTLRKAGNFAAHHDTPLVQIDGDKAAIGAMFSRNAVAMAAISDIALAEGFLKALGEPERYQAQMEAVHKKAEYIKARKQQRGSRKQGKR